MFRNWLTKIGVPAVAGATLLFSTPAGMAQKGGKDGHGGRGGGSRPAEVRDGRGAPAPRGGEIHRGEGWHEGQWHGDDFHHGGNTFFFGFGGGFYSPGWYYGRGYSPGWYGSYPGYYGDGYDYGTYSGNVAGYPPADTATADIAPPAVDPTVASIFVHVPADAEVLFDNEKTSQTGEFRQFETPSLAPGRDFTYQIRARWMDGGRSVDMKRKVTVRAGDRLGVDFMANARR
jgi:uncharacterized protein (TIGR03000 family)